MNVWGDFAIIFAGILIMVGLFAIAEAIKTLGAVVGPLHRIANALNPGSVPSASGTQGPIFPPSGAKGR